MSSTPDSPEFNNSKIHQLQHQLSLCREENKLAAEHALDLLDHNKILNLKITDLTSQVKDLQENLDLARQQRDSVAELGHDREMKLKFEVSKLASEISNKSFSTSNNSFLVNELNSENEILNKEISSQKNILDKLSNELKSSNKQTLDFKNRESKYLKEISKLEEENSTLQENCLKASKKLSEISFLENELLSQNVRFEEAKRNNDNLQELICLKEDELKELQTAFCREKSSRLNCEASLKKLRRNKQKKVAGLGLNLPPPPYSNAGTNDPSVSDQEDDLTTPTGNTTANSTFSLGSSLHDLQILDSETESTYSINLTPTFQSTPSKAKTSRTNKNNNNLQYELELDNLKTSLKRLEDEKTNLVKEFEDQEKMNFEQIEGLQVQLKQNKDMIDKYKVINEEFSMMKNILDAYDVKVDDLEERLEGSELNNTGTAPRNSNENDSDSSSSAAQCLQDLLSEKSSTIKKLRNLLKQQETTNSANVLIAKQNYDKMINIKTEIINKLISELRARRIKEKEFKQTKKDFISRTENWKDVLQMLAGQVKEKESQLMECRERLKLVVGQKNKMDGILLDRI